MGEAADVHRDDVEAMCDIDGTRHRADPSSLQGERSALVVGRADDRGMR
jgi:hypothetical protein